MVCVVSGKNFYDIVIWGQALKDEVDCRAKGFCQCFIFFGLTLNFCIRASERN